MARLLPTLQPNPSNDIMSRTLDEGTKEALKNGNHEVIYEHIATALNQSLKSLLDIELLGTSHPLEDGISLLQEDNALAIPKLRLVQAFIASYHKFQAHPSQWRTSDAREALDTTAVMLLVDAEHLTAANSRKHILTKQMAIDEGSVNLVLKREKYFIDSLLTSRLHRHTKSPNLWSHRRWLVDRCKAHHVPLDIQEDFRSVIFISAERHPRNYYAWCHARYLVESYGVDGVDLTTLLDDTKGWCFRHHDDVSGWEFLRFLLHDKRGEAESTFADTIKLVESFHWRNESVWYFLRNLATSELVGAKAAGRLHQTIEFLRRGTENADNASLDKAVTWMEKYPPPSPV